MAKIHVMIAKANGSIMDAIYPQWGNSKCFVCETQNTYTFSVTEGRMNKLLLECRSLGHNPFAIMYWY